MGETLAKVMHINDVTPCVKIGRFDAQLFQIKICLSFSWNLATVHSAAGSGETWFTASSSPTPTPISNPFPLFLFFPMNFKTCPQKRPNCPVSLKCRTKSSASCARPQGALMFSGCLDLPSVTAPHAFESCVRIFFCLSYDNLFSSSSPRVLRFCHRLQKPHYKIKEQ